MKFSFSQNNLFIFSVYRISSVKGLKFRYSAENMVSFLRDMKLASKVSLVLWLLLLFLVSLVDGRSCSHWMSLTCMGDTA